VKVLVTTLIVDLMVLVLFVIVKLPAGVIKVLKTMAVSLALILMNVNFILVTQPRSVKMWPLPLNVNVQKVWLEMPMFTRVVMSQMFAIMGTSIAQTLHHVY